MRAVVAFQLGISVSSIEALRDAERLSRSRDKGHMKRLLEETGPRVQAATFLLGMPPVSRTTSWSELANDVRRRTEAAIKEAPDTRPAYQLGRLAGLLLAALRLTEIGDEIGIDIDGDFGLDRARSELDAKLSDGVLTAGLADKARELLTLTSEPAKIRQTAARRGLIDAVEQALRDPEPWNAPAPEIPVDGTASPEEQKLVSDILAHPDLPSYSIERDNVLRSSLAELMKARRAARGEMIEAQLVMFHAQMQTEPDSRLAHAVIRARELVREHGGRWAAPLKALVASYAFRRGFIGEVELTAKQFLTHAEEIYRRAPITMLKINSGAPEHIDQLASSPYLGRIRSLDLSGQRIGDAELAVLARSERVGNLIALNLRSTSIGEKGIWSLAESTTLRSLAIVGGYSEYALPELARQIEERLGPRRWLHSPQLEAHDLEATMSLMPISVS